MPCDFLSTFLKRLGGLARVMLAPALVLALVGCGGGGGMSGSSSSPAAGGCSASSCGTAMITLTDATGDFTSYTVDVTKWYSKSRNSPYDGWQLSARAVCTIVGGQVKFERLS